MSEDATEDQEALDLAADWADISQGLRKDLGHQLHSQWIKPIQLGNFEKDEGTLKLYLPTEFAANWVRDRFADRLSLAWKIARGEVRNVEISVHPGRRQMADIPLGMNIYRWLTLVEDRPPMPALEAWYGRIAARPAFKQHVLDIPLT